MCSCSCQQVSLMYAFNKLAIQVTGRLALILSVIARELPRRRPKLDRTPTIDEWLFVNLGTPLKDIILDCRAACNHDAAGSESAEERKTGSAGLPACLWSRPGRKSGFHKKKSDPVLPRGGEHDVFGPGDACVSIDDAPSQVPEHAELAWYFNTLTGVGKLQRMTTWKVSSMCNTVILQCLSPPSL